MNCKPGDLAIVINTHPTHADCLGRIVAVGVACPVPHDPDRLYWLIEFVGEVPASYRLCARSVCALDSALKPVSGLPLNEEQTTDLKEPA